VAYIAQNANDWLEGVKQSLGSQYIFDSIVGSVNLLAHYKAVNYRLIFSLCDIAIDLNLGCHHLIATNMLQLLTLKYSHFQQNH